MKKGQVFLEIGSGDGRMVIEAVKKFKIRGVGIDINPLLNWWARFKARLAKVKDVEFKTANILKEDMSYANVIYIFLMPELIKKLQPNLTRLKKETQVISHGFRIPYLEKKTEKIIENKPFPTYFYRI